MSRDENCPFGRAVLPEGTSRNRVSVCGKPLTVTGVQEGAVSRRVLVIVTVLAMAGVLIVIGWPGRTVTAQQALAPYRIGYAGQARAGSQDVFSANSAGGDQRDATNRTGGDEGDPAYSPDGSRLAYTEFGPDGGSRVMVAAADGSNPVPLDGTVATREPERDPAWSPDGSLIAVTHSKPSGEGSTSVVRIIRVADGQAVGEVPMPSGLAGEDLQPAWSPDGTRIALSRRAARTAVPATNVLPAVVERPARRGETFTVDKTVRTPKIPAQPDIVLVIDATGSMGSAIVGVRDSMKALVTQIQSQEPSAQIGVVVYRDTSDPDPGCDHSGAFQVISPLVPVSSPTGFQQLQDALDGLVKAVGGGCDDPEDWINALHQITDPSQIAFRENSSRVAVLVGDWYSHDPSNGYTLGQVTGELQAKHVRLVAVPTVSSPPHSHLNDRQQASDLATATNGVLMPEQADPTHIVDTIVTGIGDLSVTVTPVVTRCDPGLSATFTPNGRTVPGGRDATLTENVHIGQPAAVGSTLHCAVEFRLNGESMVRPGYTESITVHVTDPALPLIVLSPLTTYSENPLGRAVQYPVSAVDSAGTTLTPVCTPAPGSTFPLGVTFVVCTATDSAGRTGSFGVPITVLPSGEDGDEFDHVWIVQLTKASPDRITVTGQLDISARLGKPCDNGQDAAPDWAPDGRSLVFQHRYETFTVCAAAPDGSGARQVIGDSSRAWLDPVFSPDGTFLAVSGSLTEAPGVIYTVPFTGAGAPTALISPAGGARQPAFQRLPDLAVTATATPASIQFNGTSALQFTVTNHGITTIPDAQLTATLPAGLQRNQVQPSRGTCTALTCAIGAVAPGESVIVKVTVTGIEAGAQVAQVTVRTARPDPNDQDNHASVTVTVAAKPTTPPPATTTPPAGTVSVTAAVNPTPAAYVGGDDVVVVYTIRNGTATVAPAVGLAVTLPPNLPAPKLVEPATCTLTGCPLGDVRPGQSIDVRLTFPATVALDGTTTATVTSAGNTTTASAPIVVLRPALQLVPAVGAEGFVTRVLGTSLPPGATIRLIWSPGISQLPGEVVVRPDGTIDAQMLVFHHDQTGLRTLAGRWVAGTKFGDVSPPQQFLVLPRNLQPNQFVSRN